VKSEDVSDEMIKEIAQYIIVSHTEDIEYLTVAEMTDDRLDLNPADDEIYDEREKLWRRVDKMMGKATVTVEFED
jgi:hypothetical protein